MSPFFLGWAATLVRGWARIYTSGLPRRDAVRRRAAIDSDVWEQRADAARRGEPAWLTALYLLQRLCLGVPDDLAWRAAAGRRARPGVSVLPGKGRIIVNSAAASFALLSALCGLVLGSAVANVVAPVAHSLAYAGGLLAAVSLAGWALELRAAGDDDAAGTSGWPLLLAGGLGALAMGLVLPWRYGGLLVTGPAAFIACSSWLAAALRQQQRAPLASAMLPASALAERVRFGDVIALEERGVAGISRRSLLQAALWGALASTAAASLGLVADFLWSREASGFGGVVQAGPASRFPPGSKTKVAKGRFWLVNLSPEKGGPGFLALWQKCPHLGCTVPWQQEFVFNDHKGWFRCPCHQSTYDDAGVRVYGPAPRSMDRMQVSIDPSTGMISVDTGRIAKGTPDNARFAVKPPPAGPA